ncbi:MAG: ABC transporter ATP-binding protein [Bacteroidales bacterium]
MNPILHIREVTKDYAGHRALDKVTFDVPEQSIFGLLGPNGAGKTTLIRIINQITAPDSGEVLLEGRKLKRNDISRIGYLPEERGLYKKMKVGEQALYLARLKGLDAQTARKRLVSWFDKFDMLSWWDRKVEELSKGMQQKVQFVVTVVHQPRLLIFDEPFSGFDPINVNLLKDHIHQLREEGATIIFSTHNMASVEELCDRIVLINRSRTILEGRVDELKEQFKTNNFRLRVKTDRSLSEIIKEPYELVEESGNGEIRNAVIHLPSGTSPNQLLSNLIPGVEVLDLQEILPTMNEIFIRQVEGHNHQN